MSNECMNCGFEGKISKRKLPAHQFTESGLENIVLVNSVYEYSCPECGDVTYEYPKLSQLHAIIADILLLKEDVLTNKEVIYLRKMLGLDQKSFAKLLDKSVEYYKKIEKSKKLNKDIDRLIRMTYMAGDIDREYHKKDFSLHRRLLNNDTHSINKLKLSFNRKWNTPQLAL